MKKVTVTYQTTHYYEEEIEVPDEMVEESIGDLTSDGWEYVSKNVSYQDEYDIVTEWMGIEINE